MLTRTGPFDEDSLVEAARPYLRLYTNGRVPFKDLPSGKVRYVVFDWILERWCFMGIE